MNFTELYNKDVSKFIETKGTGSFKASYLSWAYAVKELKTAYPEATYQTVFYNECPYLETKQGFFVTVRLFLTRQDRIDNIFETWTHPVLNHQFKPIVNPNNFEINTAIQRCLTKLIGISTGLGLSLYSGEDIPKDDIEEIKKQDYNKPVKVPENKPVEQVTKETFKPEKTEKKLINWITADGKKTVSEEKLQNMVAVSFTNVLTQPFTVEEKTKNINELKEKYISGFQGLTLKTDWFNQLYLESLEDCKSF